MDLGPSRPEWEGRADANCQHEGDDTNGERKDDVDATESEETDIARAVHPHAKAEHIVECSPMAAELPHNTP